MTRTNKDWLHAEAEKAGIPLRMLTQVQSALARAKRTNADQSMARLMLNAGRLTTEAREWVAREYAQ